MISALSSTRQGNKQLRDEGVAKYVRSFARLHTAIAVIILGIGARGGVPWISCDLIPIQGQPRLTAITHDFIGAAVFNAYFSMAGASAPESVKRAIESSDSTLFLSLKSLGGLVHKATGTGSSLRVERDVKVQQARQIANRHDAFSVLCAKKQGAYFVRLRQDGHVDHAVVVDAKNRAIIDADENSALRLSADVL